MTQFLRQSNLPEARVALCALASGNPFLAQAVLNLGVKVLEIPAHPALQTAVCRHADLQIHPLDSGNILVAPDVNAAVRSALHKEKFNVKTISFTLNSEYPGDIPLCCFALQGVLYGHPERTAHELRMRYAQFQPVRQGYARCSVCIVDSVSIITADAGIADVAAQRGLSVLRIRPGCIALPGYAYGFIGGCCGLLDRGLLAFTGDIHSHPDSGRMVDFCRERGVAVHSLTDGPLLDIGGILPLKETVVQ